MRARAARIGAALSNTRLPLRQSSRNLRSKCPGPRKPSKTSPPWIPVFACGKTGKTSLEIYALTYPPGSPPPPHYTHPSRRSRAGTVRFVGLRGKAIALRLPEERSRPGSAEVIPKLPETPTAVRGGRSAHTANTLFQGRRGARRAGSAHGATTTATTPDGPASKAKAVSGTSNRTAISPRTPRPSGRDQHRAKINQAPR